MEPLLSICIPTYNRVDILRNTLKSIYDNVNDIDMNDFEVVISDNSPDHSTKSVINDFDFPNLHYFTTKCEGFKNSFYALSYGKGEYLKLNNNYTMFKRGTLKLIIDQLKNKKVEMAQIIYTNGLCLKKNIREYDSLDNYIYDLSYFCSWSAGYGMWKKDFENVKETVKLDRYFPQTSLLLTQNYKNSFVIDDRILFEDQHVPKKGGYNIFKVFSIDFLELIITANNKGIISFKTLGKIKRDLLYKYLSVRYFKTVIAKLDNFEKDNIKKSITKNYSIIQYYLMIFIAYLAPIVNIYRKLKR